MKEINNSDIGLIIGFYDDKNILQIASIHEVMNDYIVTDLNEHVAKKDIIDVGFVDLNKHEQLQTRIKELESQSHINEIKAQGIDDMLNDDVFKEHVRYSLKGLETTEVDDYTYLENVRNYAEQLRTKHD